MTLAAYQPSESFFAPPATKRWRIATLLAAFFLSGASGLILELVWTRQLALVFGTTEAALSAVLAAYMAGLTVGSYIFGRWCRRWHQPIYLYVYLELGVAFSAFSLYPAIYHASFLLHAAWFAVAHHSSLMLSAAFVLAFLLIGVPATLMGGTLPALCQAWPVQNGGSATLVGILYGTNLAGAVTGALVAGFSLLPAWGISRTMVLAASLNTLAAIAAAFIALQEGIEKKVLVHNVQEVFTSGEPAMLRSQRFAIFASCGLSGLAAIIEEIIWSRNLRLVMGSSTYALTLMFAPFLLGLGLGSYGVAKWSRGIQRPVSILAGLQGGAFLSLYAATYLYPHFPKLFLLGFRLAGAGGGVFVLQALLASLLLLPLAILLGTIFPLSAQVIARGSSVLGPAVGKLYAVQTCGNVLGAALGIFWITHLGLQGGLLGAGALHIAACVVLWLFAEERLHFRVAAALGMAATLFLAFIIKPKWQPLSITSGVYQSGVLLNPLFRRPRDFFRAISRFELLFYREGPTATVSVYKVPTLGSLPHLALAIDGKVDASTGADMATQVLSAHLPLLLRPHAKDVCVIGWASGVTVGSTLLYPVKSVTAIEIEPSVISASLVFDRFNHRPLSDPRLRLVIQDARNVLLLEHHRYDVVISEPSNPWLAGPAMLFTREFFEIVRRRLNAGGVFAQWIQLYGLNPMLLRAEVRTFHSVFPYMFVFQTAQGDLLLLGSGSPLNINSQVLQRRLRDRSIRDDLARVGVHDDLDLWLRFRLGWREIGTFAGSGPLNTDDNGLLEFGAPETLYRDTLEENTHLLMSAFGGIEPYLSSPNPELPVQLAERAIRDDDWEEAEMFGREVSGLTKSADGEWVLGEIEWRQGNQLTAQEKWREGLSIDPDHFGCLMDTVLAEQQLGEFHRAEGYLARLSHRWPQDPLVAIIHGVNLLALKDAPRAKEYFALARKQDAAADLDALTDSDAYQTFLGRFPPISLLGPFYGWRTARMFQDQASASQLEHEATSALERWRATLIGSPSGESRARLLEAVDLLSDRAQVVEVERSLLEWISKLLVDPLAHYDRAVSSALMGDTSRAKSEFAEGLSQITDEDGRSQMAMVIRKLGLAP